MFGWTPAPLAVWSITLSAAPISSHPENPQRDRNERFNASIMNYVYMAAAQARPLL